jgi:four helix bundle protein
MAEGYRDLVVWQKAVQLSVELYRLTSLFPKEETYGLTSQLRRAGVSVASNIAEGWGRQSDGEYKHFLGMARGSNLELQTQLVIAGKLGYANDAAIRSAESLSQEVGRMLVGLMRSV